MPAVTSSSPQADPDPQDATKTEQWRLALRRFYLTGRKTGPLADSPAAEPALPAALLAADELLAGWPLYLPADADDGALSDAVPLGRVVVDALAKAGASAMLASEAPRLVLAYAAALADAPGPAPIAATTPAALALFRARFDLSDAAARVFDDALAALHAALPQDGELLGLIPGASAHLYLRARYAVRSLRIARFRAQAAHLCNGLSEILRLDASRSAAARAPASVARSFGGGTAGLIDPAQLAGNVPMSRGSSGLGDARRARIAAAHERLQAYLDDGEQDWLYVLTRVGAERWPALAIEGVSEATSVTPYATAADLFDAHVDALVDVVRAARLARLEIAGDYDQELHGPELRSLGWQSLCADDLRLTPAIVVLEAAADLQGAALGPLSELLQSGRPVHVLVAQPAVAPPPDQQRRLSGSYCAGLGYRVMAYRETFVVESTLASPAHLAGGIAALAASLRPGVAAIATPGPDADRPWLQLAAAHEGRATPCFVYDPAAGTTFADRLVLAANPSPELAWPLRAVPGGDAAAPPRPFTFADAAGLDPRWSAHLCTVPQQAWDDSFVPMADHLQAPESADPTLPYIEVLLTGWRPGRAIATRELALACSDHRQAWRILQELAGVDSAHANAAAAAAAKAERARADAEIAALQREHAAQLDEVRATAAGAAMERLAAVLLELDSLPAATPAAARLSPSSSPPAASVPAPASSPRSPESRSAETPAAAADGDDEPALTEDAYIDTPLCTSCNDCTGINPNLFQYDSNKQAYIADIGAGTFDQLVKAAEKCPARCIHPGAPRPGDATATADMVARAAEFNG